MSDRKHDYYDKSYSNLALSELKEEKNRLNVELVKLNEWLEACERTARHFSECAAL